MNIAKGSGDGFKRESGLIPKVLPVIALVLCVSGVVRQSVATPAAPSDTNATTAWGMETNKLQSGLFWEPSSGQASVGLQTTLIPCLRSLADHDLDFWLPPEPERYQVSLTDAQGKAVEKTARGASMGVPIKQNPVLKKRGGEYQPYWLPPSKQSHFLPQSFRPSDYFATPKPGTYTLKWQMRVLFYDSATNLHVVTLPPVTLRVIRQ